MGLYKKVYFNILTKIVSININTFKVLTFVHLSLTLCGKWTEEEEDEVQLSDFDM